MVVLACWAVFATANLFAMWHLPGAETIPFHFVWISIALVFGINVWPTRAMMAVLAAVTVSTGYILWHHADVGEIGLEETAEVPLMAAVFLVMVWHVRGRQAALAEREDVATLERKRAETQALFVRLGSHELRTSITVARGYVELIRAAHEGHQTEEDAGTVLDELSELDRLTARLTMLMQLDSPGELSTVDIGVFVHELVRRWTPIADRRWVASATAGTISANEDSLRAALNSLLENAVAFTRDGDRIEVAARRAGGWVFIEVSDTGVGIAPENLDRIFDGAWSTRPWSGEPGRGGTGLGLAIVRAAVETLGGTASVTSELGRGSTFTLSVPGGGTGPAPAIAKSHPGEEPLAVG
ncbi:HAMP domain-containing sensor histidine kinase [Actinophytocola sp.]|uniref:sensor histidine kinase n=1 Tax=Actinophytocola sp. TaxID=1872138 RepID=UPI002ED8CB3A